MLYIVTSPFNYGGEHFEPNQKPVDIKDPECWKFAHNNGMAIPFQGVASPVIPVEPSGDIAPALHSPDSDAAERSPFDTTDIPNHVIDLLVGAGVMTIEQAIDHEDLTEISGIGPIINAEILNACEAVL